MTTIQCYLGFTAIDRGKNNVIVSKSYMPIQAFGTFADVLIDIHTNRTRSSLNKLRGASNPSYPL